MGRIEEVPMPREHRSTMICALGLAALAACGSKEEIQATAETKASAVESARSLAAAPTGDNLTSEQALAPLGSAFGSASAVQGADSSAGAASLGAPVAFSTSSSGCVQATPGHITFTRCSTDGGSFAGQVTYGGGTFTADLTATVAIGSLSFSVSERAELHLSATRATGSVHVDVTLADTQQGLSGSASEDVAVDVGFTAGCPTSGSITVDAHGESGGRSASASVEAQFGPACGDVRFFR
jgi:hypothetical protein